MKITLYNLMQSMPIFQKLVVQPFPAKQAFLLARLTKKLDEEMTNFNDCRRELILKYAQKDTNGEAIFENDSVKLMEGTEAAFQKESVDLLNTEIELAITPIKLDWLENATLTPQEMATIEPFIEE